MCQKVYSDVSKVVENSLQEWKQGAAGPGFEPRPTNYKLGASSDRPLLATYFLTGGRGFYTPALRVAVVFSYSAPPALAA